MDIHKTESQVQPSSLLIVLILVRHGGSLFSRLWRSGVRVSLGALSCRRTHGALFCRQAVAWIGGCKVGVCFNLPAMELPHGQPMDSWPEEYVKPSDYPWGWVQTNWWILPIIQVIWLWGTEMECEKKRRLQYRMLNHAQVLFKLWNVCLDNFEIHAFLCTTATTAFLFFLLLPLWLIFSILVQE